MKTLIRLKYYYYLYNDNGSILDCHQASLVVIEGCIQLIGTPAIICIIIFRRAFCVLILDAARREQKFGHVSVNYLVFLVLLLDMTSFPGTNNQ